MLNYTRSNESNVNVITETAFQCFKSKGSVEAEATTVKLKAKLRYCYNLQWLETPMRYVHGILLQGLHRSWQNEDMSLMPLFIYMYLEAIEV